MTIVHSHASKPFARPSDLLSACLFLLLAIAGGCNSHSHTFDSKLRKIDEMLDAKLPKGTSRDRVAFFLTTRGYAIEESNDKYTIIAVVRHIDTDTLQPATARVQFHFDTKNMLTSYDLQRAPDVPW